MPIDFRTTNVSSPEIDSTFNEKINDRIAHIKLLIKLPVASEQLYILQVCRGSKMNSPAVICLTM